MNKLDDLRELFGYETVEGMLQDAIMDSVCPAICMNDGCNATYEYEPDQDAGWCEECETNSVKSAMILAGVV